MAAEQKGRRGSAKPEKAEETVEVGGAAPPVIASGKPEEPAGSAEPKPDGDDHITAFERQMERLVRIAEEADFESGSLRGDIRDTMLDIIKSRPKPWSQLSEMEQRDLVNALDRVTAGIIKKMVFVLAEQDDLSVHATLKGYSADGGTFKLKLVANGDQDTAVQLYALDGHEVVLISADAKRYQGARKDPEIMPDQPGLKFADQEIRSEPPPPADDSDLDPDADKPEAPATRINPKSGVLQTLAPDGDPDDDSAWEDVRDATPEELAAAREAQADFEEGDE